MDRRGRYGDLKSASLKDVARRILNRYHDFDTAKVLVEKIKTYLNTHKDRDDISLGETKDVYNGVDFGDKLPLTKKKDVDIDWSNHAEYRSELRDVDHEEVNRGIVDWLKERLLKKGPDSKKVNMKLRGTGTAVVDYDLTSRPASADVITVWASTKCRRSAMDTEMTAAITSDYGISRRVNSQLKPILSKIVRSIKKHEDFDDSVRGVRFHGDLADLVNKSVPPAILEELEKIKFEIRFQDMPNRMVLRDAAYDPRKKVVILQFNTALIQNLQKQMVIGSSIWSRMQKDAEGVPSAIIHELNHAIRDARSRGTIERYIDDVNSGKKVYEDGKSHMKEDFEIDAQISQVAYYKKKYKKDWDVFTLADLFQVSGDRMKFPRAGTPHYRTWVKRLLREDLLGDMMKREYLRR